MNWIKCSTRLPDNADPMAIRKVLVYSPDFARGHDAVLPDDCIRFGWRMCGQWKIEGSPSSWDVTHWMPLPGMPEGLPFNRHVAGD